MKAQRQDAVSAGTRIEFVAGWRHAAPAHCGFHAHATWEIIYHLRGTGRSRLEDGPDFDFEAGAVELIPPGVRHGQDMSVVGEDVCIHFSWRSPAGGRLPGPLRIRWPADDCLLREMQALSAAHPDRDPLVRTACDHRVAAVVCDLLQAADRAERSSSPPSDRYARWAHDHVWENGCTIRRVEEVARVVGIGPDHLRHLFRRRYGKSLKAWLMEARIRQAKSLLSNSPLPLKAIAELCGFENERYFSTSFRRAAGVPPGAFRAASTGPS